MCLRQFTVPRTPIRPRRSAASWTPSRHCAIGALKSAWWRTPGPEWLSPDSGWRSGQRDWMWFPRCLTRSSSRAHAEPGCCSRTRAASRRSAPSSRNPCLSFDAVPNGRSQSSRDLPVWCLRKPICWRRHWRFWRIGIASAGSDGPRPPTGTAARANASRNSVWRSQLVPRPSGRSQRCPPDTPRPGSDESRPKALPRGG